MGALEVEGTIELKFEGEAEGSVEATIDGVCDFAIVGGTVGRSLLGEIVGPLTVVRDGDDPIPSAL